MKNVLACVIAALFVACSENGTSSEEFDASAVCPVNARGTFVDERDGQVYKYTTIGNQVWMAQNLNYAIDGSSCYYTDDDCREKGRIYSYSLALRACPSGWHLPGNNEWKTLIENIGGENYAGYRLKATYGWTPLNPGDASNGSDECGFSALPAKVSDKSDDGIKAYFIFSQPNADRDFFRNEIVSYYNDVVNSLCGDLVENSVRCVKD